MAASSRPPPARADRERALALGGIFQALALVRETAYRGEPADAGAYGASLGSVFRIDAPSAAAIYGGAGALRTGLETLLRQLDLRGERNLELARYCAGALALERKLIARPDVLAAVRAGIEQLVPAEQRGPSDEAVVEGLGTVYRETLSTLPPRILVSGDPALLAQDRTAARIRALLLAAVRSAVLWRQVGGSRPGLLLGRRRIVRAATALLAEATDAGQTGTC